MTAAKIVAYLTAWALCSALMYQLIAGRVF
jgi:hypothetical protein